MTKGETMSNDDEARAALDKLHATIGEVTDSEGWKEWLRIAARFHNYSVLNVFWMHVQWEARRANDPTLPPLSQPAAFSTWKGLGRHVRKGEKALSVLAPIIVRDRETDERICVGFRLKRRTFDVSQTDGADLPENPLMPSLLTGEADPATWAALVAHAESLGFSVRVEPIEHSEANGFCDHATKRIVIREGRDGAQQVKTLMHEIAHAMLHGEARPEGMSYAEAEVEAESTAFVVAHLLGFDTAAYSVGYVATWASRDDHGKCLARTADRVVKAARKIAEAVAEHATALAA